MDELNTVENDPGPENLRRVRVHYEAFARSDIESVVDGLHPDVSIRVHDDHGVRIGEPIEGHDSARAFFKGIQAAVADSTVEIENLRADGDRVLARVQIGGTLRQSGVSGAIPAIHLFTVCDGLITEIRTHRPNWDDFGAEA